MLARLRMHESWVAKYERRHPEHRGKLWTPTLRTERLRWHWAGRGRYGWQPDFERLWNLSPRRAA